MDAGYSPEPDMLRAPDVAIGNVPDRPGWIRGVPELAVEYADIGQDEDKLQQKITDLLDAGTRYLWVVRLAGPRRVEVYRPGEQMSLAQPGDRLSAPGVLQNPVLVESLYDRSAAERATLTNLLQRQGYEDLDAVLREGKLVHARDALHHLLTRRKIPVSTEAAARIDACRDLAQLETWNERAADASPGTDPSHVFGAD